ncbi:MAG: class I SAM-dependent methyltransferase [Chloroflexota bacterium]|nr:class I SAM-dependent methyltransferase [Chloroflexota bacterium]
MNLSLLNEILETRVVLNKDGNPLPLTGHIDRQEGLFLSNLILNDPSIVNTLEIGCAFGISSLYICNALRDRSNASHTILDPYQYGDHYQGIGALNLKRAGIDFFNLIDEKSEIALPKILNKTTEKYDLIFIDGLHTFDQASVDFYFANRLVRKGGFIVFDDSSLPSVAKVISYAMKYPAYSFHSEVKIKSGLKRTLHFLEKFVPDFIFTNFFPVKINHLRNRIRFSSMVALQKVSEDDRDKHWITLF